MAKDDVTLLIYMFQNVSLFFFFSTDKTGFMFSYFYIKKYNLHLPYYTIRIKIIHILHNRHCNKVPTSCANTK